MRIKVNGEPRTLDSATTVAELLQPARPGQRLAVAGARLVQQRLVPACVHEMFTTAHALACTTCSEDERQHSVLCVAFSGYELSGCCRKTSFDIDINMSRIESVPVV